MNSIQCAPLREPKMVAAELWSPTPRRLQATIPLALRASAVAIGVSLWLAASSAASQEILIDGIAAQVGSSVVLVSEVTDIAAPIEERMRNAGIPENQIQGMRAQTLDRLIEAKLIDSVVERLDFGASERDIDATVARIARANNISTDQLYASVRSHGLSVSEYRFKIRGEVEREKVMSAMVRSKVKVSDAEVNALYDEKYSKQREGGEEFHLRHIVVSAGSDSMRSIASSCSIIEDASKRVKSGEVSFEEMARNVSDANAEEGGDIGWIHSNDLAPWMLDAIEGVAPGHSSKTIEMPFGCNLLYVEERRTFEPVTLAMASDELFGELYQTKTDAEYRKWVDELRDSTYIERKGFFIAAPNLNSPGSGATP